MPRTIEEGFGQFHKALIPTLGSANVRNHRGSIRECLTTHFTLTNFFQVGSVVNGTDIRGHSHTDYFAVIPPTSMHQNSRMTLEELRIALANRFPATHHIRIEPPAIVVPFGEHAIETSRVIPAEFYRKRGELSFYEIPDRNGSWMVACPTAHNDYITYANVKCNRGVKPLIRFVKAWKYQHHVPVNSFYLEVFIARFALQEGVTGTHKDIERVLKALLKHELSTIYDPLKIEGEIVPCLTEIQRKEALTKIDETQKEIARAYFEADKGSPQKAFAWWQMILGPVFPAYRDLK